MVPTPVQQTTIAAVLQGRDVLVRAQTGSGKTAAFALPLLQQVVPQEAGRRAPRRVQALVLVPTRELAVQVGEVFKGLAAGLSPVPKISVVFGGVSINPQMMGLRGGTDIVVATPGRLLDLVDHNALQLSEVHTLVLDEADRLLDQGFSEELARIVALLPVQRQSLFFSATFGPQVGALAQTLLRDPVRVEVPDGADTLPDIAQSAIAVDTRARTQLLRHLIQQYGWSRTLVFVATKYAAEIVADKLRKAGLDAEPLHGQLKQLFNPLRLGGCGSRHALHFSSQFFPGPAVAHANSIQVFRKRSEFVCHLLSTFVHHRSSRLRNYSPVAIAPIYASSRTIFPLSRAA